MQAPAVFVVAVLSLAVLQPARAETTLRLLSGWTPNNPNVPLIEAVFIKNVEAASNGELKIQRSGPEVASAVTRTAGNVPAGTLIRSRLSTVARTIVVFPSLIGNS